MIFPWFILRRGISYEVRIPPVTKRVLSKIKYRVFPHGARRPSEKGNLIISRGENKLAVGNHGSKRVCPRRRPRLAKASRNPTWTSNFVSRCAKHNCFHRALSLHRMGISTPDWSTRWCVGFAVPINVYLWNESPSSRTPCTHTILVSHMQSLSIPIGNETREWKIFVFFRVRGRQALPLFSL